MKKRTCYAISALFVSFLMTLISIPVWAADAVATDTATANWAPPADWFIYLVILIVLLGSLISIMVIRASLGNKDWSLADALSEEIEITKLDSEGNPVMDSANKPLVIKKLCPSSSRMVAFMGMIVILFMFLAFGSFALFAFAKTGEMPQSIGQVVKFLVAGLTLFAPYAVNKFSSLFEGLAPKK